MRDAVDHWVNLIHDDIGFHDIDKTRDEFYVLADEKILKFFCIDFTGILAYLINTDIDGKDIFTTIAFYIKPCYRGSVKLLKKYIDRAEREAKKLSCASIQIGGSIGSKDEQLINLLKRWGYCDCSVKKNLEV